jgi:ribosomal-protein-alanine N-acetyltransferase
MNSCAMLSPVDAPIYTPRLELVPMTLPMVEAVMLGDRARAEAVANARLPAAWPGSVLVERAFSTSLEAIRADPEKRLWGDRLLVSRDGERNVIGSVVFHGRPDDGVAEVGYGVEERSQGLGLATEGTRACVEWALSQPGVLAVTATTFPWHRASIRVIEKLGMRKCDTRDHEILGEMWIFELRSR